MDSLESRKALLECAKRVISDMACEFIVVGAPTTPTKGKEFVYWTRAQEEEFLKSEIRALSINCVSGCKTKMAPPILVEMFMDAGYYATWGGSQHQCVMVWPDSERGEWEYVKTKTILQIASKLSENSVSTAPMNSVSFSVFMPAMYGRLTVTADDDGDIFILGDNSGNYPSWTISSESCVDDVASWIIQKCKEAKINVTIARGGEPCDAQNVAASLGIRASGRARTV